MTPKDVEAIIDIWNSKTGHLVRMVKKEKRKKDDKFGFEQVEFEANTSNQGKKQTD